MTNSECSSCHSEQTPWWSCLLLAAGAATYDTIGDRLVKSPDPGDKAAGFVAKGFGKLIDTVFKFYCR